MKRALNLQKDLEAVQVVQNLTTVFESIASIRISQIRDQVLSSQRFFSELWQIYSQLRLDPHDRLKRAGRRQQGRALVIITSEGGLSGDIDQRIVGQALDDHQRNPEAQVISIGSHGSVLLRERGFTAHQQFDLPPLATLARDLRPVRASLASYSSVTVYYQRYQSLLVQETAKIDLISAVRNLGEQQDSSPDIISSRQYLFEPSVEAVADFMETVMLEIALSQVVLDSRLAQFASRFNAMRLASERADEVFRDLRMEYHKAKRSETDERLKEVVNGGRRRG